MIRIFVLLLFCLKFVAFAEDAEEFECVKCREFYGVVAGLRVAPPPWFKNFLHDNDIIDKNQYSFDGEDCMLSPWRITTREVCGGTRDRAMCRDYRQIFSMSIDQAPGDYYVGQTRRGCAEEIPNKYRSGKCYDKDDVETPWPGKMVMADDEGDAMGNDTTMGLDWDELPEGEWNETTQALFMTMLTEFLNVTSTKGVLTTTTTETPAKATTVKSTAGYKTVDEQNRSPQAWEVPNIKFSKIKTSCYCDDTLQRDDSGRPCNEHIVFPRFGTASSVSCSMPLVLLAVLLRMIQ